MSAQAGVRRPLLYLETAFVAVCCMIVVIGLGAIVLTLPGYTSTLVSSLEVWEDADIGRDTALDLAESVRRYVTSPEAEPLPVQVGEREGFSEEAVSHLDDVRAVIALGRVATGGAAALVAIWLVLRLSRRDDERLGAGLAAGGVATLVVLAVIGLIGVLDFDAFFSGFHGVFFEEGTWTFSSGSLLIQLFPLRFWVVSAGLWAILTLAGGTALVLAGNRIRRAPRAEDV